MFYCILFLTNLKSRLNILIQGVFEQ